MAVVRCPECHRIVSSRLDYCSCCGLSKTEFAKVQEEKEKYLSQKVNTMQRYLKRVIGIVFGIALVIAIVAILGYVSEPLHGDDKIAYDLISSSLYFHNAKDIEVLAGTVSKDPVTAEGSAYVTIKYTDTTGNKITGYYRITEKTVDDLQKLWNESKVGDDNRMSLLNSLEISQGNYQLDYETITKELNK